MNNPVFFNHQEFECAQRAWDWVIKTQDVVCYEPYLCSIEKQKPEQVSLYHEAGLLTALFLKDKEAYLALKTMLPEVRFSWFSAASLLEQSEDPQALSPVHRNEHQCSWRESINFLLDNSQDKVCPYSYVRYMLLNQPEAWCVLHDILIKDKLIASLEEKIKLLAQTGIGLLKAESRSSISEEYNDFQRFFLEKITQDIKNQEKTDELLNTILDETLTFIENWVRNENESRFDLIAHWTAPLFEKLAEIWSEKQVCSAHLGNLPESPSFLNFAALTFNPKWVQESLLIRLTEEDSRCINYKFRNFLNEVHFIQMLHDTCVFEQRPAWISVFIKVAEKGIDLGCNLEENLLKNPFQDIVKDLKLQRELGVGLISPQRKPSSKAKDLRF